MRIFYNLDCIRAPMTGVAYYTQNMVSSILKNHPTLDVVAKHQQHLLSRQEILRLFETTNTQPIPTSSLRATLIQWVNQSAIARSLIQSQQNCRHRFTLKNKLRGYIYHEPNFTLQPHEGLKVLTVHDVSMFACPEFLPTGRAKFLQQQMRDGMQKSDALIVSCQFIKDQIINLINLSPDKIHIIAPGAQKCFKPRDEKETKTSLEKFSLTYKHFILCVATLEPRKNIQRLIQAYLALPKHLQESFPLVLVGTKGWMYTELMTDIKKHPDANIHLLRYIDETTLLHLYSSAKLFVYPSLYEGFGLPVLEAMQSGAPVITSNTSSLPEVCGDAGILIDPLNINSITEAMTAVLMADAFTYHQYVDNALKRAQQFSWDTFAKQLFEVYTHL